MRSRIERDRRRAGITLVEVVVVTAVVAVAAMLTLPAIRAAQIFSRRAQCANNLKQIGLSCHNYESAFGSLPMSRVEGEGHGVGQSQFVALLPFLELAPVFNAYNFHLEPWASENDTVTRTRINVYLCPDNRGDLEVREAKSVATLDGHGLAGSNTFAPVHYGANWGGGHETTGTDFAEKIGTYKGMIVPVLTEEGKKAGVDRNINFSDVTDGTSLTLMIGEKLDGDAWAVGGWANGEYDVHTSTAYDGDDALAKKALTGSPHSAGPNFGFGDGSVRPLAPTIDREVWYALNTRAGGEVIRPDDLNPR